MPFLKQVTSAPQQKKPGNKFFVTIILIGVAALVWIWLKEKPSRSKAKSQPESRTVAKPTKPATPFSVLVMNKTNLPSSKTNATPSSQVKTPATVPIVLAQTNGFPGDVFVARPVKSILEAQVALVRRGISAGSIDGVIGSQTRAALRAFQQSESLPITGELDALTKTKLVLTAPPYTELAVTTNDFARLQPLGTNWFSKAQQSRMGYETILELVSEKVCCHPNFIKQLNPSINWTNRIPMTTLRVPNIEKIKPRSAAAFVRIRLAEKYLEAFDADTNLLAHFPCSIAQRIEKRPVGRLRVEKIAENPDYTFDPETFPESAEARQIKTKLILSPGPNNPVGTVWIGLDRPGYGIHGTPKPEEVGRTESHGCFRLANWNAEYLVRLVSVGTPVLIEP
ncbi:MAG: L,D-transpeptidase family protein [Verrucomicrobiota bacterium]